MTEIRSTVELGLAYFLCRLDVQTYTDLDSMSEVNYLRKKTSINFKKINTFLSNFVMSPRCSKQNVFHKETHLY